MPRADLGAVVQQLHKLTGRPAREEPSDGEMIERFVARREESAFAVLVRRHGPLVLRVCRRVLGDAHDADDAFQATFLVLARNAASIRKREALGSWLYGTALRVARKARLSEARRQARETRAAALPREDSPEADDWKPLLDEELGRLAVKHRAPLVLCYLQGMTYGQAARELGWSEGSMSRRLAQARELLRERLVRRGIALGTTALVAALSRDVSAGVSATLIRETAATATAHAIGLVIPLRAAAIALADGAAPIGWLKFKVAATMLLTLLAAGSGLEWRTKQATPVHASRGHELVAKASPGHRATSAAPLEDETDDPENKDDGDALEPIEPPSLRREELLFELPPLVAPGIKRRCFRDEDDLLRELSQVATFNREPGVSWRAGLTQTVPAPLTLPWLGGRAMQGLTLRTPSEAPLGDDDAFGMHVRSRGLRHLMSESLAHGTDRRVLPETLRKNFRFSREFKDSFLHPTTVPVLVQVLGVTEPPLRETLVEQLGRIDHPRATGALVNVAVFDVSPGVRAQAVQALRDRPLAEVRPTLLDRLGYPWAPAADHAAEALVALDDCDAIPALVALLNEPDAKWTDGGPPVVREMVKLRHATNCLTCHAPSTGAGDPLRASVPMMPDRRANRFIRADTTYLHADFAALLPGEGDPLGEGRYDYLVRERLATFEEATARALHDRSPRCEAIRFALRELSQRPTVKPAETPETTR